MSELKKQKEIVVLEKRLNKEFGEGFTSDLRALPVSELDFKLLQMAKHFEEIVTTQREDDKLRKAREGVRELNAPYVEQKKQNKLKSRFLALLIEDKKES